MWFFVASLIISLAIALLTPKPKTPDLKPAGIKDFNIPTVSESRNIALLYGTDLLDGPNVLTYGGLWTVPITKESGGGLFGGGDDVTVGYRYYLGLDFSLCWGPIDALYEIRFGDYLAWSGALSVETGFSVVNPFLFGGDDGEGGVQSTCVLYIGNTTQVGSPIVAGWAGAQPGNRNVAHVVWGGGYIGNSQYMKPVSFVAARFPNSLNLPLGKHIIGQDANPACMIYDLFVNKLYGKGYDSSYLDTANFISIGETLYAEGLGMSAVWDSPGLLVEDIIDDILRHINATRYLDLATGKIRIRLVRDDFVIANLPLLDETMVEDVEDFTRGAMGSIATEVRINYRSRSAGYKQRVYIQSDTGARHQLGFSKPVSLTYTGITTGANAAKLGRRELLPLSKTPATCTVVVNRNAYSLVPGDPFRLKWSPADITQIIMRVKEIDYGTLTNGQIRIACTEDVYSLANAIFDENPASGWVPIQGNPLDTPDMTIVDMPYWIQQALGDYQVMFFAQPPRGDHTGYSIWKKPSGFGSYTKRSASLQPYVQLFSLAQAVAGSDTQIEINTAVGYFPENVTEDNILTSGRNIFLLWKSNTEQEFIGYTGFVDNGDGTYSLTGVLRGLMDTTPLDFALTDKVFFLGSLYGRTDAQVNVFSGGVDTYNISGRSQSGEWDIADASTTDHLFTLQKRTDAPWPMGRFYTNGVEFPTTGQLGNLVHSWAHRSKTLGTLQKQNDSTGTLPASTTYTLEFRNNNGTLIRTYSGITLTTQTYLRTTLDADNGGASPAFVDVSAYAVDSVVTLNSFFPQQRRVWTVTDMKTIFQQLITGNQVAFNGQTLRNLIPAQYIIQNGDTLRFSLEAFTGQAVTIGKMYVGHPADTGDAYDFDGNQVQVTFDTGNPNKTIAAGTTITSDDITFSLDADKDLLIAVYFTAANCSYGANLSGCLSWFKAGDDAATGDATGYTTGTANRPYLIANLTDPT